MLALEETEGVIEVLILEDMEGVIDGLGLIDILDDVEGVACGIIWASINSGSLVDFLEIKFVRFRQQNLR